MNKLYVLIISLICAFALQGQVDNSCFNASLAGTTIDTFNWTVLGQYDNIYVPGPQGGSSIEIFPYSPFYFNADDENIEHLFIPIAKDFSPTNGWELLYRKLGKSGSSENGESFPFFALYNRFEGVVRFFVYIPIDNALGEDYNQAQLKLLISQNNNQLTDAVSNGALEFLRTPLNALDRFEKQLEGIVPNSFREAANYWLFAEYPVAYDPCVCNYTSTIEVETSLIDITTITLVGNAGGTIEAVASGGSQANPSFTSILKPIDGAVAAGNKVNKTFTGYHGFVEDLASVFGLRNRGTNFQDYNDLNAEGKKKFNKPYKTFSLPDWTKDIPNIGTALALGEFLIGGGGGNSGGPTSFEVDLKYEFSGQDSTALLIGNNKIYTPGSPWGSVTNNEVFRPVYDNPLGVFNLLETPKITRTVEVNPIYRIFYYQFLEELKYVVNPASGLEVEDIRVAIVLKENCVGSYGIDLFNSSDFTEIIPPGQPPQGELPDPNIDVTYITPFVPLNCINDYIAVLKNGAPDLSDCGFGELRLRLQVVLTRAANDPMFDPAADDVLLQLEYKADLDPFGSVNPANQPDPIAYLQLGRTNQVERVGNINLTGDRTIYAWSTIYVEGPITTNGHRLTIIAGEEIIVSPDIRLPSEVDLLIGLPPNCEGDPYAGVSLADVDVFCNNAAKYDPGFSFTDDDEKRRSSEISPPPPSLDSEMNLSVFPNPVHDRAMVKLVLPKEESVTIELFDSQGKLVVVLLNQQPVSEGMHTYEIMTDILPGGIYFVRAQTSSSLVTARLVK